MENDVRVRYSVYMDKALSEYMEKEVSRLGLTKSGFINLLVSNDKREKDVLTMANGFTELVNTVNELQKVLNKEKEGK